MMKFHDIAKGSDFLIKFTSVATGLKVEFPAFLTDFSDPYTVGWNGETVYGRTDPIQTYQGTTRTISMAFDVVSVSLEHAKENMFNYSKLTQMLYPVYSEPLFGQYGKGRTLKAPPLMRVEFANLVKNNALFSDQSGLMGAVSGFTFNPNRDAGWFSSGGELLAKHFNLSFTMEPLHEGELGFEQDRFLSENFPYGRSEPRTPSSRQIPSTSDDVSRSRIDFITGNGEE